MFCSNSVPIVPPVGFARRTWKVSVYSCLCIILVTAIFVAGCSADGKRNMEKGRGRGGGREGDGNEGGGGIDKKKEEVKKREEEVEIKEEELMKKRGRSEKRRNW